MDTAQIPLDEWLTRIVHASTLPELEMLELDYLGRNRGILTAALKELGAMSPDDRKRRGAELNSIKLKVEDALMMRRNEIGSAARQGLGEKDRLDMTLELPPKERGHLHPVVDFMGRVEEVFCRMGFDVSHGTEIEHEDFNFTFLNIPPTHPARDMQATFWLEDSDHHLLRTHTSTQQIHYMRSHEPPFRMISTGATYRKDSDATHSPMFHQFDGMMVGKDISLANMKGIITAAFKELVAPDAEYRFRASYFPFVEPGLELDMRWSAKGNRWLEMGGCGMMRPEVLKNGGLDPKKWQGFAFGFGVERPVMIKHGIRDLRAFYDSDLRFLRQFA